MTLDLANRRVLVLGLGVSGQSAARFCAERGARVVAADERPAEQIDGVPELGRGVETRLGRAFPDTDGFDVVVPSPGVPAARYRAAARHAAVWGDLELAYRALSAPIIAVTGTNGKSTVVRLLEALLRAAGTRARAAGNLGVPALSLVGEPLDFAILEVSSFQLEAIDSFRPTIAVWLNLTPDHLDRHGDLAGYTAAKARLLANQRETDVAVLNFDDATVAAHADRTRARVLPFRTAGPLAQGAFYDAGAVVLQGEAGSRQRVALDGMRLSGLQNRENAVAALAAVHAAGVDVQRAASALATFEGLPHRCERVGEVAGVVYVNDSKATNPGAALRSLAGFAEPIVWIAGGRDKHLDFAALVEAVSKRARAAVLIGEATAKLSEALRGRVDVHTAASLEAAVRDAAKLAQPGDVVLLSPACASQDQFRDFEERGERFRRAVAALSVEAGR